MGHVAEHVALELQRLAGGTATRGKTRAAGPEGQYFVVFAFDDAATGLAAGQSAVSLVNRLINEDDLAPGEVDGVVAELARLLDRGRLGPSTQAIVDEARRRHIPWTRLDDRNLVELGWGVHLRRIRATVTSATGLIAAELARDKDEAGALLERAGVPSMHTHPTVGRARNVGGAILDQLFGRGSEGRIPIAAVTGSNGKTTTVRLLAHILSTAGRATGFTTTESIVANGLVLRTGDMAGPASARLILANPTIQAAVLEVARGGILRDGLGYDYNDVAIVTNVTGDHLGLDGISTLKELASVKAVIVDAVPRSGTAVLNADDPLVMEMAGRCRGAVALVSSADDPTTPGRLAVRRHAESGGLVGYVTSTDGLEHLIVRRGTSPHLRVPLANIPITWQGAARMHVANAVAAACGAIALDIPAGDVQRGLATFLSSPGRVERHLIDGREIVLDYGHNFAALRAIGELIGRIGTGRRVIGVVSMPGDRRDEDRVAFGALAGSMFDRLFVAEPAIRGRPSGEAAALMITAARRAPDGRRSRSGEPTFIPDEADATRAAFVASRPGDLLVLCVAKGPRAMAALTDVPSGAT